MIVAVNYMCCEHCILFQGECADGIDAHTMACPEIGCDKGDKVV